MVVVVVCPKLSRRNQKAAMMLNFFGRLLFPHQAPWQQRQQLINIIAAVCVALVVAGIVVGLMFFVNARK